MQTVDREQIFGPCYPTDLHCWGDAGEIRSIPDLRDCQASSMNEQLLTRFIQGPRPTLFTDIDIASLVMSIMLTEQVLSNICLHLPPKSMSVI